MANDVTGGRNDVSGAGAILASRHDLSHLRMLSIMCVCYAATTKAYDELRKLGKSEGNAYDAAVRIYRHHHPEQPRIEAYRVVADWLDLHETAPQPQTSGT
jgi:hypothetical protein